jgi:hypothetical protein
VGVAPPASTQGMSADQLLVLVLLAASFAAGWVARGGRQSDEDAPTGDGEPAPPESVAAADPLIDEADTALNRAITAARAARAMAAGAGGSSEAASRAALGVLDTRVGELEDVADRLEDARGPDDPAFLAFDRVVSGMVTLRRRVDGDGVLAEVEAARAGWELAVRP